MARTCNWWAVGALVAFGAGGTRGDGRARVCVLRTGSRLSRAVRGYERDALNTTTATTITATTIEDHQPAADKIGEP